MGYYGQAEVEVAERQGTLQLVHIDLAAVVRVHHIKELRAVCKDCCYNYSRFQAPETS